MKNSELRTLTQEELEQRLLAEKEQLQKLKFAHAVSPIENPNKIVEVKKTVARILTIMNEKANNN